MIATIAPYMTLRFTTGPDRYMVLADVVDFACYTGYRTNDSSDQHFLVHVNVVAGNEVRTVFYAHVERIWFSNEQMQLLENYGSTGIIRVGMLCARAHRADTSVPGDTDSADILSVGEVQCPPS